MSKTVRNMNRMCTSWTNSWRAKSLKLEIFTKGKNKDVLHLRSYVIKEIFIVREVGKMYTA